MCGPISGSAYSNKWVVSQCCCGCSLRTGSLIIGWLQVIGAVLNIINMIVGHSSSVGLSQIVGVIIGGLTGLFILIGTYKQNAKLFWTAVYIEIVMTIWLIVVIIIFFAVQEWAIGVGGVVGFILNVYFIMVLRSYGYEIDAGRGISVANPA